MLTYESQVVVDRPPERAVRRSVPRHDVADDVKPKEVVDGGDSRTVRSDNGRARRAVEHAKTRPQGGDVRAESGEASRREGTEPLYKRQDNHWTPYGNRLAARELIDFLAALACPR